MSATATEFLAKAGLDRYAIDDNERVCQDGKSCDSFVGGGCNSN